MWHCQGAVGYLVFTDLNLEQSARILGFSSPSRDFFPSEFLSWCRSIRPEPILADEFTTDGSRTGRYVLVENCQRAEQASGEDQNS